MNRCFWQTLFFFKLLIETIFILVAGEAKPGFPGTYPLPLSEESDSQEDFPKIYDSDVNIPGRHFPRLPYKRVKQSNHQSYSPKFGNTGQTHYMQSYEADFGDDYPGSEPVLSGPYFDRNLQRNVSVQLGKTAILTCRVFGIGDKSVSWIRHGDLHILTVGKYKYSMDSRVSVVADTVNNEWILRVKDVTYSDAGRYECQISTDPVLSFIVNLEVFGLSLARSHPGQAPKLLPKDSPPNKFSEGDSEPHFSKLNDAKIEIFPKKSRARAFISEGPDIHVHQSSMINLTCEVNHGTSKLVTIDWYHYNKLIDVNEPNKAVWRSILSHSKTVSNLLIRNIKLSDSGKYTCEPSNGDSTSITLHVHSGDIRAAMQANEASSISLNSKWKDFVYLFCIFLSLFSNF